MDAGDRERRQHPLQKGGRRVAWLQQRQRDLPHRDAEGRMLRLRLRPGLHSQEKAQRGSSGDKEHHAARGKARHRVGDPKEKRGVDALGQDGLQHAPRRRAANEKSEAGEQLRRVVDTRRCAPLLSPDLALAHAPRRFAQRAGAEHSDLVVLAIGTKFRYAKYSKRAGRL